MQTRKLGRARPDVGAIRLWARGFVTAYIDGRDEADDPVAVVRGALNTWA